MSEYMAVNGERQAATPANAACEDGIDSALRRVAELEKSFKDAEARIQKETADHRRRMRNLRGNRDAIQQALEAARVRAENERLRSELERIRREGSGA